MNQIPNIEETVDKFIKDNGIVLLAEYTKGDVIGLQSIRTEIENLLHQQLQKVREEERERIINEIKALMMLSGTNWEAMDKLLSEL